MTRHNCSIIVLYNSRVGPSFSGHTARRRWDFSADTVRTSVETPQSSHSNSPSASAVIGSSLIRPLSPQISLWISVRSIERQYCFHSVTAPFFDSVFRLGAVSTVPEYLSILRLPRNRGQCGTWTSRKSHSQYSRLLTLPAPQLFCRAAVAQSSQSACGLIGKVQPKEAKQLSWRVEASKLIQRYSSCLNKINGSISKTG
ncbi:hypothetical protein DFH07DRAFT_778749 [Mycena maculata]|uniref:Uncharacterized protein n=1 Tax=Mycena maculata TaxID=230809 RepID=A0AAD7IBR2_9AGAR|nr:hypothetical protein DFH07DRAFT_778749 [Mycena maculata]